MHIVVARCNENLDWLEYPAIVYNKGNYLPNTIPLPNIGREAHTYLYHICANYANLAEVVVFTQGYIGDHMPPGGDSNPSMYLQNLAKEAHIFGISNNYVTTQISPAFNIYQQEELKNIYKVENPTSQVFGDWFQANFNMPFPANCCNIYYGAVFAIRRDKILSRSKEFYQKLLRQLVHANAPIEAHFLERSWWYIPHHTFSNTRFYGICLKDNKERLNKINAIQDILPQLQVVNAVDARQLSDQDIQILKNNNFFVQRNNEYVDSFGRAYQKGAVACFLSHKKVMEMVKRQNEEYAVVFEDDIRLLPDFHEKMYKVFELLKHVEFDICNLYVHPNQKKNDSLHSEILWVPPGFIGTQCLLFKKSSIHRVLASLQQYSDPIDEQLSRDLDLQYIYITNNDLLVCDEIPSIIQDPNLKFLTI